MTKVLLAEDDQAISEPLARALRREGYEVDVVEDGPAALEAGRHSPDMLILDLGLPGMDGLDVCRRLRAEGLTVPVLILTARADEVDTVVGLDAGADDYVTKPFRMREVVARIQALLRRVERAAELTAARAPEGLVVGDLGVDPTSRRVTVAATDVHLTPLEFDLLVTLAAAPDRVFTREELLREVWGWADAYGTRTLDSHVKSLRAKIGAARIRTVHGVGYALEAQS